MQDALARVCNYSSQFSEEFPRSPLGNSEQCLKSNVNFVLENQALTPSSFFVVSSRHGSSRLKWTARAMTVPATAMTMPVSSQGTMITAPRWNSSLVLAGSPIIVAAVSRRCVVPDASAIQPLNAEITSYLFVLPYPAAEIHTQTTVSGFCLRSHPGAPLLRQRMKRTYALASSASSSSSFSSFLYPPLAAAPAASHQRSISPFFLP